MTSATNDFDFFCNNDSKYIRIAVKDKFIHTITIKTDTGRSINFEGGTANVETIALTKCFKLTDIVWAKNMGVVKRLRINYADDLSKLDLTSLVGLEELSIIDCGNLYHISGLPATLKVLNIHGAPIETLDVSSCPQLTFFNLVTTADQFTLNIEQLENLSELSVVSHSEKNDDSFVNCNLHHCEALHTINFETGFIPLKLNLLSCPNLTYAHIASGPESVITNLSACVKLDFIHLDQPENIELDAAAKQMIRNTVSSAAKKTINTPKRLSEIKDSFSAFRPRVLDPKPGTEDIETIIQHNGSARERQRASEVIISLLGLPSELPADKAKHDSMNHPLGEPIDNLKSYLGNRTHLIYYLETDDKKSLQALLAPARIPKMEEDTIHEWLINADNRSPNILLLTEDSLQIPTVKKFIATFNPRKQVVIYKGYYRLTPQHKIVASRRIQPVIERFSTRSGLPVTAAEQHHFEMALNASHHLIYQANKKAALHLIPARQLQSITRRFLLAAKNANTVNMTYQPISAINLSSLAPATSAAARNASAGAATLSKTANPTAETLGVSGQSTHPQPDLKDEDQLHSRGVKSGLSDQQHPGASGAEDDRQGERGDLREDNAVNDDNHSAAINHHAEKIVGAGNQSKPDEFDANSPAYLNIHEVLTPELMSELALPAAQQPIINTDKAENTLGSAKANSDNHAKALSNQKNAQPWQAQPGTEEPQPGQSQSGTEEPQPGQSQSETEEPQPWQSQSETEEPQPWATLSATEEPQPWASLSSSKQTEPVAPPPRYAHIEHRTPHKGEATAIHSYDLPIGQHGKLSNETEQDIPLASARINSHHEATAQFNSEQQVRITTQHLAATELITSTKDLLMTVKQMLQYATTKSTPPTTLQSLMTGESMLDSTYHQLMSVSNQTDLPSDIELENSLSISKHAVDAVRCLNLAFEQIHLAKLPNFDLLAASSMHLKSPTLNARELDSANIKILIKVIKDAQEAFIKNHRKIELSSGIFGTGFSAGINNMRLQILNSFLHALETNQRLTKDETERGLKEICKDPKLKLALESYEEVIKYHVAAPHSARNDKLS